MEQHSIQYVRRHTVAARNQARSSLAAAVRRFAVLACIVGVAAVAVSAAAQADGGRDEPMQGLDQQVQEIKSDVLAIAAELNQLEERLLYPSDTQVAVFVAIASGDGLELDSVQISIDGEVVARHVYSFKEVEALRKGGVQRIHTGNLRSGNHALEISALGKLPGGGDFEATRSFRIDKGAGPQLVELTLAGSAAGDDRIRLGES